MRRITSLLPACLRHMRRAHKRHRLGQEHGAVAIIVALAMVALLGSTALAVDVGAMYAERAQLQNGADAAALAVAQTCATGTCGDVTTTAQSLANANANDNATDVSSVTFPAPGKVTVTTTTRDGRSGAGSLALAFAPVLGIANPTLAAQATAGWGGPNSGPAVLPLAFAPCDFLLNGPIQVLSMHGDTGGTSCSSMSPSGQLLPGGFGWLADPTGTCKANVTAGANAPLAGSTGVSISSACMAVLASLGDKTVLLPVYEDIGGTGSGAWYKIRGWAAFKVLGWNFPGYSYHNTTYSGATCSGSCKGIIGKFVSFVTLDNRFTMGGPPLGSTIVTLTK